MKFVKLLLNIVIVHSIGMYAMDNHGTQKKEIAYQLKLRQNFENAQKLFITADNLALEIIKKDPAGFQFTGFTVNMTKENFTQKMSESLSLYSNAYKLLQSIIVDNKACNEIKKKAQELFNARQKMALATDSIFSFAKTSNIYGIDDKEFSLIISITSRNWKRAPMGDNEWKSIADIVVLREFLRADLVKACKQIEEFYNLMKRSFNSILFAYPYQKYSPFDIVSFATNKYLFDNKLEIERKEEKELFSQIHILLMNIKKDKNADDEIRKEVDVLYNKLIGSSF